MERERPPSEGSVEGRHQNRAGRRKSSLITRLWITATPLLLAALLYETGGDLLFLYKKVLWPLGRLLVVMAGSLALSALVEVKGWNRVVAAVARPFMRFGRLSDYSSSAFTISFLSGIAGSTMLWSAYKDGRISLKEMYLAALLNVGLPSYFLHLPVTMAIIIPLVGTAGAIYMAITFLSALLRSVVVLLLGRVLLNPGGLPHFNMDSRESGDSERDRQKQSRKKDFSTLFRYYITKRFSQIVIYTVPIYILVVLMQLWGLFDWLKDLSATFVTTNLIPVEGVSVVVFSIVAEFAAGAAAAGAMVQNGILTTKETVIALVLGNLIATPVRAIRHQLPRYIGIFKPAVGIKLLLMGQMLRVISVLLVSWLYLIIF